MQRQSKNRKNQKARDMSVHEEIAASHVILDGELSPSRLDGYLLRDREEDELDFKDAFDWTARTTKSKL